MIRKPLNIAVAAIFLLFAFWQFNDPDPLRWVALYGAVAVQYAWASWKPLPLWIPRLNFVLAALWFALLLPEFINWLKMGSPSIVGSMKAETPYIEYTREFLGLLICSIALARLAWPRSTR